MIRAARADDLEAVVRLEEQLFGPDAWDAAAVQAELDGIGRTFLVSEDETGNVIAYAVTSAAGEIADILRIGVAPQAQRGGLASGLLAALVDSLATTYVGLDRMLLEVSAINESAIAFYDRHGFAAIDTRRRYYRDGSDAVVMLRPLARADEAARADTTDIAGEDGAHA